MVRLVRSAIALCSCVYGGANKVSSKLLAGSFEKKYNPLHYPNGSFSFSFL